jgi:hypothetical protein
MGWIPTSARFLSSPQPPVQWVPAALSLEVKQQEREADYSPPSSAEVKKSGAIALLPHVSSTLPLLLMH